MSDDNQEAVRKHQEIIARTALFQKHIDGLAEKINNLIYSMITTDDGFPVAHTSMDKQEAMRKAAIASSLNGLSSTVAQESNLKKADATHIECGEGFIFSRTIYLAQEQKVVLLLAVRKMESLAMLLFYIKKMVDELADEFEKSLAI